MLDIPHPLALKSKVKPIIAIMATPQPKGILPDAPTDLEEAKKRIRANMKAIEASADAIRKRQSRSGAT